MGKGHKKSNKSKSKTTNFKQQNRQNEKKRQQETRQKQGLKPCDEGEINLKFHAFDTWFFRESRPHDAAGASELSSLFPPPIRTLAGALRTYIGDAMGIDWKTLHCENSDFDFEKSLGNAEHLGELALNGAWIVYNGQRLYPAPLYLMQKDKDTGKGKYIKRLQAGKSVRCDLGFVRLPEMPKDCIGYKGMEKYWVNTAGLRACLDGNVPAENQLIAIDDLFSHEPRLGIARDNEKRAVIKGQLYQTQHIRLKDDVHIEVQAKNVGADVLAVLSTEQQPAVLRFGGEGRMAGVEACGEVEQLPFTQVKKSTFTLHFITPADFNGQMFPDAFNTTEREGQTIWHGELNGVRFSIEAAVIGKAHREGGWDMQKHQPRAVKSYIPAGSTWFCRLDNTEDYPQLDEALHGQCIGMDSAYGRGQILIGQWSDTDNQ